MNKSKHRRRRLADFRRRKAFDPSGLSVVSWRGWEYIPVHPTADVIEWSAEHSLSPRQRNAVDCYWRMGDEVVFLQVVSNSGGWGVRPGLYARWAQGATPMLYLVAVVDQEQVSQLTLEGVMAEFRAIHQARGLFRRGYIGKRLRKLDGG